jgi:hypothetical membrane protein
VYRVDQRTIDHPEGLTYISGDCIIRDMSEMTSSVRTGAGTTAALLACGVVAGPFYVVIGVMQMLFREGFDLSRHPLSVLSNGSLGWIQIANFLVSGALTVACAVGLRRALAPGRGARFGPLLVGVYGAGVFLNGLFRADPVDGFPPGTPLGPPTTMSWQGATHFLIGAIAFFSLIAACFVLARRFFGEQRRGWAIYSVATGVLFLAGFLALPATGNSPAGSIFFAVTILAAWTWLTALAATLRRTLTR